MSPLDIVDSAAALHARTLSSVSYRAQRLELPQGLRGEALTDGESVGGLRHRLPSAAAWRQWLEHVAVDPSVLPGYATLKYSKSGEVFRAMVAETSGPTGGTLQVACRVTHSESYGTTWTAWRRSRARRNFHRAMALLRAGIDTAIPLAWMERPSTPRTSWLVTAYVGEVVDLDQIALTLLPQMDRRASQKARNGVVDAVVELLVRLDRAGLHHRDLKASNILITNWEGRETRLRPMLVDLDGLHPRRWWSPRERRQPLIRLAASLRDYPGLTRTDFARFLLRYLTQAGRPRAEWKTHFRRLARDATLYAQRSQLRKTHKLDGFTGT